MRGLDFTSWQALLSTLLGLITITVLGVGLRLIVMQTVQQRRERANRQINERLRTLIAAYKTLGGSFTGDLHVDPTHLRQLRERAETEPSSDRSRRIRDAVEAALSDIILLGTEEQVRLAARAAAELVAGRPVHVDELVVSLRNYIREVLELDAIAPGVQIPKQGPTRPGASGSGSKGKGDKDESRAKAGGGDGAGRGGLGVGLGGHHDDADDDEHHQK